METDMTMISSILTGPAFRNLRLRLPLGEWIRVSQERRRLAMLSEQQLRDIGIDAAVAAGEASRPFWDLPTSR
jgi:uncharacterized protein YjiS (DUF1127 family)